jgi:hypothetical protein
MEDITCNICGKSLVLNEVEYHINEDFHENKKKELLNQLMDLQLDEYEPGERSSIDYWRNI